MANAVTVTVRIAWWYWYVSAPIKWWWKLAILLNSRRMFDALDRPHKWLIRQAMR